MDMLSLWFWFGIILMFAEFILPGLVVVFVGLGAMTVALLLQMGIIESIPAQFTVWFMSSIFYTLTLRMVVLHFYPMDTTRQNIDGIKEDIGRTAQVIEPIKGDQAGRIAHRESTWSAIMEDNQTAEVGDEVVLVQRTNITWLVKKSENKET